MKRIISYMTVLGAFVFSSCGDSFLDSVPYTSVTDINFYKTPDDAYKALVGTYDGLQRMYSQFDGMVVGVEILSDNTFGGGGKGDGYGLNMMDEFDPSRSPTDVDMLGGLWGDYYKGIYRCNVLLSKLDGVNWGDQEDLKNVYAAEAKFIRAVGYFDLVRLFGNIVLITEPTSANLPQSDPADVYKVIADDLKFAIENLPAVPYSQQSPSNHGRVTKWAAEALMARVFLYYTGYYGQPDLVGTVTKSDALGYVEDVIANSGHQLVSDFASLWPAASGANYAGERNVENIFNIKYTYTSSYNTNEYGLNDLNGNYWLVMMGLRGGNFEPYGQGWGACTVNPKLWDAYDDNDTRKVASIISIADEGIAFNTADQREYTGYSNKKYTPMSENDQSVAVNAGGANFQIGQFQDYIMIRYADVLLMAAELGSPNAQTYFDKVRQRAFQANFTSIPVSQANIMEERRLEFAFEGIRYWDLLRQGVDVAANTIAETASVLNGGVPATVTISASNIQTMKGLQQIPKTQITLSNGVLKQNTGW